MREAVGPVPKSPSLARRGLSLCVAASQGAERGNSTVDDSKAQGPRGLPRTNLGKQFQ